MPHFISYDSQTGIVETRFSGLVTIDELKEAFRTALPIAVGHNALRFLNNFSDATPDFSIAELYELPRSLSKEALPFGVDASRIRRAVVAPARFADQSQFAENVAVNRGHAVRFFLEAGEAKRWLVSG
jgi:hypothetical protein